MKIVTKEISGIASAIKDMRNPMNSHEKSDSEFSFKNHQLILDRLGKDDEKLLKKLSQAKQGSGHDCILKSITVHYDLTATHDFLLQLYRYSFRDTTSSSSKMHSIHKGSIKDSCSPYVAHSTIGLANDLIRKYNNSEEDLSTWDYTVISGLLDPNDFADRKIPKTKSELFECIIHNTPIGYELTLGEVTNYLQLKTMYNQRKPHKMSSWNKVFVEWVRTLPMSYLITGE